MTAAFGCPLLVAVAGRSVIRASVGPAGGGETATPTAELQIADDQPSGK
jgi:hypothetical protein